MEVLLLVLFLAIAFVVAVTLAQRSEPLAPGSVAPQISLCDQTGSSYSREADARLLVIVFLPRDETSRCLSELQEFEALKARFSDCGASIVFVSIHDVASQAAFHRTHRLTIPLLADAHGEISRSFGTIIDFFVYRFSKRTTYVCHDGRVTKTYVVVEPKGHAESVLNDLIALHASGKP